MRDKSYLKVLKGNKINRFRAMRVKYCVRCNSPFMPTHGNQIVCSDKCQREATIMRSSKFYVKNKKEQNIMAKNRYILNKSKREEQKTELDKLIGNICFICGKPKDVFHEIHGKQHLTSLTYYKNHYQDFIPLCKKCHYILSFASTRIENFNVEKFIKLYNLICG